MKATWKAIARYHVGEPTAVSASAPEDDKMNFYVLGTDGVLARIRRDRRASSAFARASGRSWPRATSSISKW